jgi:hypothetical protein
VVEFCSGNEVVSWNEILNCRDNAGLRGHARVLEQ